MSDYICNRLEEMKVCLKEQGYYISINGRIYLDYDDIRKIEDIIK